MPNTEIILAAVSASSFLVLVVFLVLFLMKVSFMVKAIAWVKKLFGTSLNDQVSNICTTSDLSAYTENDEKLWDILVDVTKDTEKCPAGSTPSPPSNSPAPTASCNTREEKATCIQSNCSSYTAAFINGAQWSDDKRNQYLAYTRGSCPALSSYVFTTSEESWLDSYLKSQCPLLNTSGINTALAKYTTVFGSSKCTAPAGTPSPIGPQGYTFYESTTGIALTFSDRDTTTVTYGSTTFSYTYSATPKTVTFTGAVPSGFPSSLTLTMSPSIQLLNGTTVWGTTTNPYTVVKGKTTFAPDGSKKIVFDDAGVNLTYYDPVTTTTPKTLRYYMNTGINTIYPVEPGTAPFRNIIYSSTGFFTVDGTQWANANVGTLSIYGKTLYPAGSSLPLVFSASPTNSCTFNGSTYTFTATLTGGQWVLRFNAPISTYGTIGVVTPNGTLSIGGTVFVTQRNGTATESPTYPIPGTVNFAPVTSIPVFTGTINSTDQNIMISPPASSPWVTQSIQYIQTNTKSVFAVTGKTTIGQYIQFSGSWMPGFGIASPSYASLTVVVETAPIFPTIQSVFDRSFNMMNFGPKFKIQPDVAPDQRIDLLNCSILGTFRDGDSQNQYFTLDDAGNLRVPCINTNLAGDANRNIMPIQFTSSGPVSWTYNMNTKQFSPNGGIDCMQVGQNPTVNSDRLVLASCNASNPSQRFTIKEAPYFDIRRNDSNWRIHHDGSTTAESTATSWLTSNSPNSNVTYDRLTGQVKFKDGLCLSEKWDQPTSTSVARAKTCIDNDPSFKWFYDKTTMQLRNMSTWGCIDIPSTQNATVTVKQCDSTSQSQKVIPNY